MKKIIVFAALAFAALSATAQRDTVYHSWGKSVGNTIIVDHVTSAQVSDTVYVTPFVQLEGDMSYPIFITQNGVCFIYKVNGKTNKPYKVILPEESSMYIRRKMETGNFTRGSIEGIPYRKK